MGPIETRQIYVDLLDYAVENAFTNAGPQTTYPSAYGYSFAGGSSEDGGGHFLFKEGMTRQNMFLDLLVGWLVGWLVNRRAKMGREGKKLSGSQTHTI